MRIGIAGVGGIGSNVAVNLIRAGIGSLTIVDFDRVELSNLNRQFYFADQIGELKVKMLAENLLRINPELEITPIVTTITKDNIEQLFGGCDLIVEGFDQIEDKKMLIEHLSPVKSLIVSANGIAGSSLEKIAVKQMGGVFVVGDFESDCNSAPLYSHKISAVAAKMAEILLTHGQIND